MTAIVRIFTHSSLVAAPVSAGSGRLSGELGGLLKQPQDSREKFVVGTDRHVASQPAPRSAGFLIVQVQEGKRVHYELTPESRELVIPNDSSPVLTDGQHILQYGPGWRASFLENKDV